MPVKHDTIFTILPFNDLLKVVLVNARLNLRQMNTEIGFPKKCGAASVGEYNRVILYYQLS